MGDIWGEQAVKSGRYSVPAAGAVLLLAAALMLGCFTAGERVFAELDSLPPAQTAAGYGHTQAEGQIDINTATEEELDTLPGIGPVKAAAIVAWRTEHGPFRSPEELIRVKGIGEGILGDIIDLITVGGG